MPRDKTKDCLSLDGHIPTSGIGKTCSRFAAQRVVGTNF